ncbi:aminopeptidase [Acidobacteriota bacterium]
MSLNFEQMLQKYAELIVKVGLNLHPGQRLLIGAPVLWILGTPIETAPFIRLVAAEAYKAGAALVDVMWRDDQLEITRFKHAPADSFAEYPSWQVDAALEYAKRGDALLFVLAETPGLLSQQDPNAVATAQQSAFKHSKQITEYYAQRELQCMIISAVVAGWAARVFPDVPPEKQETRLWNALFEVCRVKEHDPLSAWKNHIKQLDFRSHYLNQKQYTALKITAPGTDLTVGLPREHIWTSSHISTSRGISCVTGFPCEELFTVPHKDKTEGVVTATKPLNYGGTLIENLSLTFNKGRVVKVNADSGEDIIRKSIETDEGASRLGEIALLPHSSPVSQSGLLFYNTLIDENAANHIALGNGYKFNLQGGESMSDDEFKSAGGNLSLIHIDFMIGSAEMDVDGLKKDGKSEPIMRAGEWAFDI